MDILCDAIGFTLPPVRSSQAETQSRSHLNAAPDAAASPETPHSRPHPGPPHRCHLCARTYERADHLNRHLKSHENARPFKCTRCMKSFNRADLLNRHETGHDRHGDVDGTGEGGAKKVRIERGERVGSACRGCVASKSKCQEKKPCARCVKKGVGCESGGKASEGSRGGTMQDSLRSESVNPLDDGMRIGGNPQLQKTVESQLPRFDDGFTPTGTCLSSATEHQQSSAMAQRDNHTSNSAYFNDATATNPGNTFFNEPFQDFAYIAGSSQFSQGLGFMPRDSHFSQDLDFGMWDIDLESIELAYQNTNHSQVGMISHSQYNDIPNPQKDVSKRYAAFERSPWLWTPTQKDQALNDQHDLSLDEESIPSVLTPASPAANVDDFSSCFINSKTRDQMLGLLYTLQKNQTQVLSFPTLALLNSIIEVFFIQESFRVNHLIHSATFDSGTALPQLLIAVVAAGSTLISTPAIWKLGLALQEVVRCTVGEFWEQNNTNTRNLQAIQAFVIAIDIGLWSGFKRKMEIAEAFGQPVVVMLRRAGAFAAPQNASVFIPDCNDSEAVLDSKWRKWVERESFKRLVLYLFVHDVHASIGLQKPPLMTFTELKFALPASRHIWLARTAHDWKERYLYAQTSNLNSPIPSFMEAMLTPDLLTHLSNHIDPHLSTITLLHGFWGQIWTLLESQKFFPPSKATHRLCLLTSHTELYRDLTVFSSLIPSLTRDSPEATLVAELLMMILHASPEDLQRFAGKFGEDEARKASGEFQQWSKGTEARIAVWHAGQVIRAASRLGPAQLRGFNAIAVYYASLTLWTYGLMNSASHRTSPSEVPKVREAHVVLNETESIQTRSWRSSDDGVPGLNFLDSERNMQFVPLEATDRILGIAKEVYRSNFPAGEGAVDDHLPPLVENLGNLLRDLGGLPGSRVSRDQSPGAG